MALKLADVGALEILDTYLNGADLTLKLFTNNITPLDTSVAGDFTVAAGGGYADKTLTAGNWTVASVADIATASYAQQQWTFAGALTGNAVIYGYYVVDAAGTLIWAERAPATYTPANNGDMYNVTPKFQLGYGTPVA